MDALSLLTSSVPGYFVIGPLFIVLIILVVMIGKSDKTHEVASAQAVTPPAVSTTEPSPVVVPPMQTPSPAVEGWHSIPPVSNVVPAVATPIMQSAPATPPMASVVTEAPAPVTQEINPTPMNEMPQQPELVINHPTPPPEPASIPPISSWKPAAPTPTAVGEMLGESEGALQAHAIAEEAPVAPVASAVESMPAQENIAAVEVSPSAPVAEEATHPATPTA